MKQYGLAALQKVRIIHQEKAFGELIKAKETHARELVVKQNIEHALTKNRLDRRQRFDELCSHGVYKTHLLGLFNEKQNSLRDEENALKKSLVRQDTVLQSAKRHEEQKFVLFQNAEKDTKVIDKHWEKWQQQAIIAEEKKVDKENDDFNAARFKIRLKA